MDATDMDVLAYLPLVKRIAAKYWRSRLPLEDRLAEGWVGLLGAFRRGVRGSRLGNYARRGIQQAIRGNRLINIPDKAFWRGVRAPCGLAGHDWLALHLVESREPLTNCLENEKTWRWWHNEAATRKYRRCATA